MADRPSMPRCVVFDFGAVLFRWQPAVLLRQTLPHLVADDASARSVAAQIFESFTPGSDWLQFDLGRLEPEALAQRIAARTGLAAADVRRVIDAIPGHMTPLAGTVAVFRALKAAGYRTAYLSNMPAPYADHLERTYDVVREFDSGIFSARVGLAKPAPAIFALADARFATGAEAPLFIDDHPGNVAAAQAHGWQALRFTDADQLRRDLQAGGWLT